jgi:molybdenum cofactor cytidylyltransferase
MLFGLVPAAGESSRMGRSKLALPLGSGTVLGWVIDALRQGGVDRVVVVVGPHVAELTPLVTLAQADVCVLVEKTKDMRATVQHGLQWAETHYGAAVGDRWLLAPADQPKLRPPVVRRLIQAGVGNPRFSILVPTYNGRRGHPALIDWKHAAGIRDLAPGQGIDAYFRQHAGETLEVPIDSPTILDDLDTPEDYERLRQSWTD